jgi:hypothetical protein
MSSNNSAKLLRRHVRIAKKLHLASLLVAHGAMLVPSSQPATLSQMLQDSHLLSSLAIHFQAPSSMIRLRRSLKRRKRKSQNPSGDNSSITCMVEDAEDTMRVDHTKVEDTMRVDHTTVEDIREVRDHHHQ